jgi:hypothetical protein
MNIGRGLKRRARSKNGRTPWGRDGFLFLGDRKGSSMKNCPNCGKRTKRTGNKETVEGKSNFEEQRKQIKGEQL